MAIGGHLALGIGVEEPAAGDGDVDPAPGVSGNVVDHPAEAFQRLAVQGVSQELAPRLQLDDRLGQAALGHEQLAVLAARDGPGGVGLVEHLGQAGGRIDLDHVAGVVVGDQHGPVRGGDRAVDVVALPRPDGLPALAGGDHARDGGRGRREVQLRGFGGGRDLDAEGLGRRLAAGDELGIAGVLPGLHAVAAVEGGGRALRRRPGGEGQGQAERNERHGRSIA